jgi:hypothetical protein
MQMETNLCIAVGIDVARLAPMDVYLLGGRIIADEALRKEMFAGGCSREQAISEMLPNQLASLRERILGVVQFKSS